MTFLLLLLSLSLTQKPDGIDVKGPHSCSALMIAVCKGLSSMVELLVGWGADVNAVDSLERTLTHVATSVEFHPFDDSSHLKKVVHKSEGHVYSRSN